MTTRHYTFQNMNFFLEHWFLTKSYFVTPLGGSTTHINILNTKPRSYLARAKSHFQKACLSSTAIYDPKARTTDAQWSLFSSKSKTFGLGHTIWANKFWGIKGYFQTIYQHPCPFFPSINNRLNKSQIFVWVWDLN